MNRKIIWIEIAFRYFMFRCYCGTEDDRTLNVKSYHETAEIKSKISRYDIGVKFGYNAGFGCYTSASIEIVLSRSLR